MNVRMKSVHEICLPVASAFAFVVHGAFGVTKPACESLDDDELAAVCAHELAHLSEGRWVRAARAAYAIVIAHWVVAPAWIPSLVTDTQPTTAFYFSCAIAASAVGIIIYRRIYRCMEIRADKIARQFAASPGTFARALERLYATDLLPVVFGTRRQVHADLYDRMVADGATPLYPRPDPPPNPRALGLVILLAGIIAGSVLLDQLALAIARL
jgi:hypothetical protein